jgi:hypothetical protein
MPRVPPIRESLLWPILAAFLLHLLLVGYSVRRHKADVSSLMLVSETRRDHPGWQSISWFHRGDGYDGQFYYRIAQNPFRSYGAELDHPVRHLRVLYPLLCHALTAGHPRGLIWVMPGVNLLALTALTALACWYAKRHGRNPWWGFTLPLVLNLLAPLLRNLTDPTAALGLLALLIAWEERWNRIAVLAAAVALFSREQNAAVLALVGLAALFTRQWMMLLGLLGVGLLWALWFLWVRAEYGQWPLPPGAGNFAEPFVGLQRWWNWTSYHPLMRVLRGLYLAFLLGECGLLFWLIGAKRQWNVTSGVGLAGVALLILAGPLIWEDWWAYVRAFVWLPLAVWLMAIRTGFRLAMAWGCLSVAFLQASVKVM